jgi:hypothetical protein
MPETPFVWIGLIEANTPARTVFRSMQFLGLNQNCTSVQV